jgi:lipid II:glycine glycyltransferase (peptidoglycan interpeptide bridge formation enzyme)
MQVINKKVFIFNVTEVYFSKNPFDIEGCDYLIFPQCKNKVEAKGFICHKKLTSTIDLTKNLDTIWENFDKKSTRYSIKRAERENVIIKINHEYDQFFQIFKNFRIKKRLNSFLQIFGVGKISLDTIKKNGTLFVADYNGETLGGTLFLEDDSNIEMWFSASKRLEIENERRQLIGCANRLILWEVIKYAKQKGIKELDLGGLFLENEAEADPIKKGINSFKLSFGGEVVSVYSYDKFYSKSLHLAYLLYRLTKGI